ncbi:hypothetical protein ACFE04_002793 [Oxalis oulophora]
MDSITNQPTTYHQNTSGLLRFRSAPTSYLDNFTTYNTNMDSSVIEKGGALETQKLNNVSRSTHSSLDTTAAVTYYGLPPRIPCSMVSSSLLRQSSSPAGVFGYSSMKGSDDRNLPSSNDDDARFYSPGFTYGSWNESSHFPEDFHGVKGMDREIEGKLFSGSQNGEFGNRVHLLSHHLSLPKTSSHMNAVERFLEFQDSVPCKIRAKRGCATHPRSIAERVRRTRISERMRKLQELVPNMDKQTNTADMLDLAVDYIKDLQKQYKTLSNSRANCKCSSIQEAVPSQVDTLLFCTEK